MRAMVLRQLKSPLQLEQRPDPQPAAGQVVVALKAAALNRRDYWITQGMYPGIRLPVVLGSDGAGVVTQVGDGVPHHWAHREVILYPGWNWGNDPRVQGSDFRILGMPDDGTFAEQVVVPVECLEAKPEHLDWHEAATVGLSGVTAYRAVFRQGGLEPGETVLITGIGGGVATWSLQLARRTARQLFVTSSSADKLRAARDLGATDGFDYTDARWAERLAEKHGPVDLIIDSAGGPGYGRLIELAAPGGRIVNYGATAGMPDKLDLFKVFWKQLRIIGSTMGSPDDFRAMLEMVRQAKLTPVVDQVLPLQEVNEALGRLAEGRQLGNVVLRIGA